MYTQSRRHSFLDALATLWLAVAVLLTLSCSSGGGGAPPAARLLTIAVTPPSPSVPLGFTQPLVATGTYSDLSTRDLSTVVTWASNNATVATVNNAVGAQGTVTTVTVGSVQISATDPETGVSGATALTVSPAVLVGLAITPPTPSVALGYTQQLTATGTFSDRTTRNVTEEVDWRAANGSAVTVSNTAGSKGLATTVLVGTADVFARQSATSIETSTPVTVTPARLLSIDVTPPTPTLALGYSRQFTATGNFSDQTTADLTASVTWSASDTAIATVSNTAGSQGLAEGLAVGAARIIATDTGTNISGSANLGITAAELVSLAITPPTPSIALGRAQQFTAIGTFSDRTTLDLTSDVTWASSSETTATISNAAGSNGLANSAATGSTTIGAAMPGTTITTSTTLQVTAAVLVSIDVTPSNPDLPLGLTGQFTATGTFSDNSTQDLTETCTWTSSNTDTATVSNAAGSHGLATSVAIGTTTMTATDPTSNVDGATTLTVTPATLVSIDISPRRSAIPLGLTQQYTATGNYSDSSTRDLTTTVVWSSSELATASISNAAGSEGLATSLRLGSTEITASLSKVSGLSGLQVTDAELVAIDITPAQAELPLGLELQFTATGRYTDNSTQDLTETATWASATLATASISNATGSKGLATSAAIGSTEITASIPGSSITGATSLDVTAALLVAINVTPGETSIALGRSEQYTAMGRYSDNSVEDLTETVTWSTSDTDVATVSNAAGSQGLASSVDTGEVTIRASRGEITGSAYLEVTRAVLVSLDVTPAAASTALGFDQQFQATGTFSDNTTQDLTETVTWRSYDSTVAVVDNSAGSRGLATTLRTGFTWITAIDPESFIEGSTSFSVTPATLVSLRVEPRSPGLALGYDLAFTATGTFSDRTTRDISTDVTWTSATPATATISNADGSQGLATSVALGSTEIRATYPESTISDSTTLEVTPAVLVSLTVTPVDPSVALGFERQFTATGTFSDRTTQDMTTSVTWSSSDTVVAQVGNAVGVEGLATTLAVGQADITAAAPGTTISGSSRLSVTPAVLTSITVVPMTASMPVGLTQQFRADGRFSDGSTTDITSEVTWTSTNTAVAPISNAAGSQGLATAMGIGSTVIRATDPTTALYGTAELDVTVAELVGLTIETTSTSVAPNFVRKLRANGSFTDGSQQDVTSRVTWGSSNTGVVTVSNASGNQGYATGVALGRAVLTATDPTTSVETTISLDVEPIAVSQVRTATTDTAVTSIAAATPEAALGDVLIAVVAVRTRTPTVSAPGWIQMVRRQSTAGTPDCEFYVFRRNVAINEPTTHTFSLNTAGVVAVAITALQGVDTTTTVNVNASAASAAGLSHNAPSITTTVANTMLLTVHAMASSTTWTQPTGMTELVDLATNPAPDAAGVSFTVSRELRPTAGATGARTATANAGATAALGGTYTVALRSL